MCDICFLFCYYREYFSPVVFLGQFCYADFKGNSEEGSKCFIQFDYQVSFLYDWNDLIFLAHCCGKIEIIVILRYSFPLYSNLFKCLNLSNAADAMATNLEGPFKDTVLTLSYSKLLEYRFMRFNFAFDI